jgi:hypothetical protein
VPGLSPAGDRGATAPRVLGSERFPRSVPQGAKLAKRRKHMKTRKSMRAKKTTKGHKKLGKTKKLASQKTLFRNWIKD